MRSVSLQSGRCLMLVLLLAPVLVRPKGLEFQKNEWTEGQAKQEGGKYDNLAPENPKNPSASPNPGAAAHSGNFTVDRSLQLLGDDATDPAATMADGSTSGSGGRWIWAILGSLCVAGLGLASFSYYWSHMRRVASW